MENQQDFQDFQDYLSIQNPKVRKNSEIVSASDLQFPFMLHIDAKVTPAFIPMMPRRAAMSEDNTIPRVTVADTLLGCIVGYASFFYNMMDYSKLEGYVIHKLPFNHCIRPNEKLVYDAEASNEHWLIGYNKQSLKYPTEVIGKMFLSEILLTREPDKHSEKPTTNIKRATAYFEIDEPILVAKDTVAEAGYYELTFLGPESHYCYDDPKCFSLKKIGASEYMKAKNLSAATLDLKEKIKSW